MKGLSDVLKEVHGQEPGDFSELSKITHLSVKSIVPYKLQPRQKIDLKEIDNLSSSIERNGLINPILVRPIQGGQQFEIVAGERRWMAVRGLGWKTIPSIIKQYDEQKTRTIALVENIQRERLSIVEEAKGYLSLIQDFHLTHKELATIVGKPRSTISNKVRLLDLSPAIQKFLENNDIDFGHAKLLLGCNETLQTTLAKEAKEKRLSVKQLEDKIKLVRYSAKNKQTSRRNEINTTEMKNILKKLFLKEIDVVCESKHKKTKIIFSNENLMNELLILLEKITVD